MQSGNFISLKTSGLGECAENAAPITSLAAVGPPPTLALTDPKTQESIGALAAQLPALEALFNSLMQEALTARYTTSKVALVRAALQAQNNYTRTVTKLAELNKQRERSATLTLGADDWD